MNIIKTVNESSNSKGKQGFRYNKQQVKSEIGPGLLVLAGIEEADNEADIEWLCSKIVQLRIFNDSNGVMNLSVQETGGEYWQSASSLFMQKQRKETGHHISGQHSPKWQFRFITSL